MSSAAPGSATEIGTINTGVDVTNLLGFTNTQLIVTDVTPAGWRHRGVADGGIGATTRSTSVTATRTSTPRSLVTADGYDPAP